MLSMYAFSHPSSILSYMLLSYPLKITFALLSINTSSSSIWSFFDISCLYCFPYLVSSRYGGSAYISTFSKLNRLITSSAGLHSICTSFNLTAASMIRSGNWFQSLSAYALSLPCTSIFHPTFPPEVRNPCPMFSFTQNDNAL